MTTWKIVQLERQSTDDLVTVVHWEATKSEQLIEEGEVTKTYNARVYGSVSLERGEEFIPFNQLTEELVIGWVKDTLGVGQVASYEAALQTQIDNQKNPPVITGLPW